MARQKAVLHHLGHHALVKARAVQVGRLLGLQQLGVERLGRHQKTEPQPGRQHLGERAQVDAALGVARSQRQRRWRVKPQVAIGVVFNNRQAQARGLVAERGAARLAHGAAGRVLEIGQHVKKSCAGSLARQVGEVHALVIAGHAEDVGLHSREGLQRAQIGRGFHQHAAARVNQHLGDQVKPLLRAGGDQDLRRVHVPGQHGRHHLAQRRKAFAGGVLQRSLTVFAQHLGAGLGKRGNRKGLGRGQATGKADDAGLFSDLQDLADHRGVHFLGACGHLPIHSAFPCLFDGCSRRLTGVLRCPCAAAPALCHCSRYSGGLAHGQRLDRHFLADKHRGNHGQRKTHAQRVELFAEQRYRKQHGQKRLQQLHLADAHRAA